MRKTYSESFKRRVIKQLFMPNGKTASELSRELGLSQSTLSRWRTQVTESRLPTMSETSGQAKRESEWSAQEKYRFLLEAAACSEKDLGALLRRRGVYEATHRQWEKAALSGLCGAEKKAPSGKKALREEKHRVRQLERELRRKDAALAEAAALLVLKKKLPYLLGVADESTITTNE